MRLVILKGKILDSTCVIMLMLLQIDVVFLYCIGVIVLVIGYFFSGEMALFLARNLS